MALSIKHPGKRRFKGTAGETLAVGEVVCIKAADGKIYQADANGTLTYPAIGVIGMGGASAAEVEVLQEPVVQGFTGLTPGKDQFLSETAGGITETAPTLAQKVGNALSATEVAFTFEILVDNTPSG
jgi:hypothetical protein